MARNLQIEEGMVVKYLARKISDDNDIQVYIITEVINENWEKTTNNDLNSEMQKVSTHERVLLGRVVKRTGSSVIVETNYSNLKHIQVELNEISCQFLPMFGDEVSMSCLFNTDVNNFNLSGLPIGCYSLKPTDQKQITGTITRFPKGADYGVVNADCIFYLDAFLNASNLKAKPDIGDSIIADVIRSTRQLADYRTYEWRCIRIVSNEDARNNNSKVFKPMEKKEDENRNGIMITASKELKVKFKTLGETQNVMISIKNTGNQERKLTSTEIKEQISGSQIQCKEFSKNWTIGPHNKITFNVNVTAKLFGVSEVTLRFSFDNHMTLDRVLEIDVAPLCADGATNDAVQSKAKLIVYNKEYTKNLWKVQGDVVAGVRVKAAPLFVINRLKPFEVPEILINTVLDSSSTFNEINEQLHRDLPFFDRLDYSNYKQYFHVLIHLEEIALDHEFRRYDRELAYFHRDGPYLALRVENVFESRPSLIIGDRVIARDPFQNPDEKVTLYEGFIHKIKKDHVLIKFGENFHNRYGGEDYRLFFKFSRSKFIKQLNAIDRISKEKDSSKLFPSRIQPHNYLQFDASLINGDLVSNRRGRKLPWFNENLNIVQKKAIIQVLRGETRPMPYIIFGPPGTGKTSTLIELILQLFKNVGGSRIIICAPSNSAANLITQRLIDSKQLKIGEFVRIVGINSIEREQIPEELHPYCAISDIATPNTQSESTHVQTSSGLILNTNSVALSAYKILISTCISFGSLMCMKFHRSHFSHVIIDEAGQCLETEAMIPISLLNSKHQQVILAGDPMQIGPIVLSKFAKLREFDKSFLVRLLDRTPYRRYIEHEGKYLYDERLITKLLYNYRSLPSILSSYDELFYDRELIATISSTDSGESKILKEIQAEVLKDQKYTENYGIMFFGIRGREEQIAESSSWRNLAETSSVRCITIRLFDLIVFFFFVDFLYGK